MKFCRQRTGLVCALFFLTGGFIEAADEIKWPLGTKEVRSIPARRSSPERYPKGTGLEGVAVASNEPVLVILVEFSDQLGTSFSTQWANRYFGTSRSVRHYYHEVSYYQSGVRGLDLFPAYENHGAPNDGVVGWVQIAWNDTLGNPKTVHPWNFYGPNWEVLGGGRVMDSVAKAAVLAADGYVDFSAYDQNSDGYISSRELHISIILAGYFDMGSGTPGPMTRGYRFADQYGVTVDGVTVLRWSIPGDSNSGGFMMDGELDWQQTAVTYDDSLVQVGPLCHEMGHDLGLPDLYDTDPNNGTSSGVGEWCLMGTGCWLSYAVPWGNSPAHLCAWCKERLGWIAPMVIQSDTNGVYVLRIEDNPYALKVWTDGDPGQEYFLVSNRQNYGYDSTLVSVGGGTASGLLIWHIDTLVISQNLYSNTVNADETHKGVDLECADQVLPGHVPDADHLDSYINQGDNNDPFYSGNNDHFGRYGSTIPDSRDYGDSDSYVDISNIGSSGYTINCDVKVASPPSVVSTYPSRNARNVPLNASISVEFDKDMDPTSFTTSTFKVHASNSGFKYGVLSYNSATKTATFDPSSDFLPGERITVILTGGIRSSSGAQIDGYIWHFTADVVGACTGTFQDTFSFFNIVEGVCTGDFDRDGFVDVAMVLSGYDSLIVWFNNGDGFFSPVGYPGGVYPRHIYSVDVDSDNDLDLVVSASGHYVNDGGVFIYKNNGFGDFTGPTYLFYGNLPGNIAIIDLEADGDLDFLITNGYYANYHVFVYRNDGYGNYTAGEWISTGSGGMLVSGDFNEDGYEDFGMLRSFDSVPVDSISIVLNDGTGVFPQNPTLHTYPLSDRPCSGYCADFNGDGHLDIAACHVLADTVALLMNDGNANFSGPYKYGAKSMAFCISGGDFDNDGDVDLVLTSDTYSEKILYVIFNQGDGSFTGGTSYDLGNLRAFSVTTADLDNDGDLDLVSPRIFFNENLPLQYIRGDANADGSFNVSDAVYVKNNLSPQPQGRCLRASDANASNSVNISDAAYIISHLSPQPDFPPPFPDCGSIPTDTLECDTFLPCGWPSRESYSEFDSTRAVFLIDVPQKTGDSTIIPVYVLANVPIAAFQFTIEHGKETGIYITDRKTVSKLFDEFRAYALPGAIQVIAMKSWAPGYDGVERNYLKPGKHEIAKIIVHGEVPHFAVKEAIYSDIYGFSIYPSIEIVDHRDEEIHGRLLELKVNRSLFNDNIEITYILPRTGNAKLYVFDPAGRKLRTFVEGFKKAGIHKIRWNGTDSASRKLGSGVYILYLESEGTKLMRKVVILK